MLIDTRNPANLLHPLNQGLQGWWLALPALAGGPLLYDLLGLLPMTMSGVTWAPTKRQGGFGQITFPGATTNNLTQPNGVVSYANNSVAAWVLYASSVGAQGLVEIGVQNTNCSLRLSTGKLFWNGSLASGAILNTPPAANVWHRVLGTATAAGRTLYVDGVSVATSSFTNGTGTASLYVGNNSTLSNPLTGAMDDIRLWNRTLTAEEARADYDLSRQGYPGMLNRLPIFIPSAAAPIGLGGGMLPLVGVGF